MTTQTEIINLEDLVPTNHLYRKFTKLIDLDKITNKHLTLPSMVEGFFLCMAARKYLHLIVVCLSDLHKAHTSASTL